MQKTEGMILTNLGNQMISQALAQGLALIFTKISIGDGELGVLENPKELSNLKKYFKDIQISSIGSETVGEVRIRGAFTNKGFTQTFHWGEIGIFAKVGNEGTEKLYSYCNFGLDTEPIAMDDGTNVVERIIDTYNIIKDTANYTAIINSSIFATIKDLQDSSNSLTNTINIAKSELSTRMDLEKRVFDNSFDIQMDGVNPRGMAYVEENNSIYIALTASKKVNVYDFTSRKKIKEITISGEPIGICYNKEKKQLYVASSTTNEIVIIDTITNSVVKSVVHADISFPYFIVYNAIKKEIYITQQSTKLVILDTNTDIYKTSINFGDSYSLYCKLDEAEQILYVTSTTPTNKLRKILLSNNSISGTLTINCARFIEISNNKIFVTIDDSVSPRVAVIDKANFTLLNTLDYSTSISSMKEIDGKIIAASAKGLLQINPVTLVEEKIIRKDCSWSFDIFKKNEVYYLSETANNKIRVVDEKVEQKLNSMKGLIDTDQAIMGTQVVGYIQDQTEIIGGKAYIDKVTGQLFLPFGLAENVVKKGIWATANSDFKPVNLKKLTNTNGNIGVFYSGGGIVAGGTRSSIIGSALTDGTQRFMYLRLTKLGIAGNEIILTVYNQFMTNSNFWFMGVNITKNADLSVTVTYDADAKFGLVNMTLLPNTDPI